MKLLHVTATHLNPSGGIPVVLRELVASQNAITGFESRVLSLKADVTEMNSLLFDYLGDNTFDDYIDNYSPDVVIFHSHYYIEYIPLSYKLSKRSIPYYLEPHGSFGQAALQKSKFKKKIANSTVFLPLIRNAYGYIFLNESEMYDSCFRTAHDLVIPNGINAETINNNDGLFVPWFFYFIGRFDINHKGLDYLFDALELLDKNEEEYSIRLYGTGTKEQIDYINKRIAKFHSISVTNCGPLFRDKQSEILEQCGIMLLTSRYEGFPMTALEAWGYGNPCIVTPGTNVADEVVSNRIGWKTNLNAADIAETIRVNALDYSNNRQEYVIRCKEYVSEKYSWDTIALKWRIARIS